MTAPGTTAPLGVYLFRSADPASELARHVERVVFMETFGNTPELLAKEYAPYEESSIFLCVVDHRRGLPAGTMRILLPSPAGFKTLDDAAPVWGEPVDGHGDANRARTSTWPGRGTSPPWRWRPSTGARPPWGS